MLRARANGETFVSATRCPGLPGPLLSWSLLLVQDKEFFIIIPLLAVCRSLSRGE